MQEGTRRDAILHASGANADHGLRRSNADKRKAVLTLLEDDEWSQWSDREIAKRCGVSGGLASRTRRSLSEHGGQKALQQPRTYKTKHGTVAQMNVSKIGRSRSRGPDALKPIRRIRPPLARTSLNLSRDPVHGARAIMAVFGVDYARQLVDSLTFCLQNQKEGVA